MVLFYFKKSEFYFINILKIIMNYFSKQTKEELKHYVYVLVNPQANKIFYVWKGQGDRLFAYTNGAALDQQENDKLEMISVACADAHIRRMYLNQLLPMRKHDEANQIRCFNAGTVVGEEV